jgi:beta-1,4-mannosyltransferase
MVRNVAVLVLGELGRSPRMQYHCISLASLPDTRVSFIGFDREPCTREVEDNPNIAKVPLSLPFEGWSRRFWLLWAPLKVLFQILQLLWVLLWTIPRPSHVLVQNPPSIPVLLVARLASWLRGAKLVIDWHNFGFTILSHSLGDAHPFVVVSRVYEQMLGRLGDSHFCVTKAMQTWLEEHWGVRAAVLYDKAPAFFKRTPPSEAHALFRKLHSALTSAEDAKRLSEMVPVKGEEETLLTRRVGAHPEWRRDRPALVVSSTSWTPDEDFGILLDGLVEYNSVTKLVPRVYPPLLVLVTGRGPQREMYEKRIRALRLERVFIRTLWLDAGDYPVLMGCADLGVSLHVSTSGLDLPMKVVDMHGAGTPACAVGFSCLGELVRHADNGLVFASKAELKDQLLELFRDWAGVAVEGVSGPVDRRIFEAAESAPTLSRAERLALLRLAKERAGGSLLEALRSRVVSERTEDWVSNWNRYAKPVFE